MTMTQTLSRDTRPVMRTGEPSVPQSLGVALFPLGVQRPVIGIPLCPVPGMGPAVLGK